MYTRHNATHTAKSYRWRSQPRAHGCTPAVFVSSRGEFPKTVNQSLRCGLRLVVKTTKKFKKGEVTVELGFTRLYLPPQ